MVSGGGKRVKDRRHGDGLSAFPASRLLVWHSSFDHARSRHASVVRGHALNQQLEIVLPTRAATDLAESLKWETSFYYEVTTSLAMFLSPRFIAEYVLQGSVYMIAKNVAVNSQNTAMLLPSGELLMLVDNETYEQLGLVGHKYAQSIPAETQSAKQHYTTRRGQRYVVRIDLTSELFRSPEPNAQRDRVVQCLEAKFEPLEMLICAYNERGAPRTIIFGDDDTIERKRVEVNGALEKLQDILVPALHQFYCEKPPSQGSTESHRPSMMDMETMRASLEGVYDWLGVVACRLTDLLQQKPLEEYVSTFDGVPPGVAMDEHGDVSVVKWRGLIAAEFTQRVLDRVRDQVQSGKIPWAAMTVWGFPDALVSWQQEYEVRLSRAQQKKLKQKHASDTSMEVEDDSNGDARTAVEVETREHGFLLNGNNNYTFLVLPQQEYFVLQELGPHDATM